MIRPEDITVVSYVQRKDGGRVPFAGLPADLRQTAADELRHKYLSALLAGKAKIVKGEEE